MPEGSHASGVARKFQRHRTEAQSNLLTQAPPEYPADEFEAALLEMDLDFPDPDEPGENAVRESGVRSSLPPHPLPAAWILPSSDGPAPDRPRPRVRSSRTPWEVHSFRDVFAFFGPLLSILAASQIYTAWALGRLAASSGFQGLDLHELAFAGLIALSLFALDAVFLRIQFGKHHQLVSPWVCGLAFGSAVFALSCHVALRHF